VLLGAMPQHHALVLLEALLGEGRQTRSATSSVVAARLPDIVLAVVRFRREPTLELPHPVNYPTPRLPPVLDLRINPHNLIKRITNLNEQIRISFTLKAPEGMLRRSAALIDRMTAHASEGLFSPLSPLRRPVKTMMMDRVCSASTRPRYWESVDQALLSTRHS